MQTKKIKVTGLNAAKRRQIKRCFILQKEYIGKTDVDAVRTAFNEKCLSEYCKALQCR